RLAWECSASVRPPWPRSLLQGSRCYHGRWAAGNPLAGAGPEQDQGHESGQRLHVEDAPGDSHRAEDSGKSDASEEEGCPWREVGAREDRPEEPRGEEAVVETLVLRELRCGLGFLCGHSEQLPRPRAPEEHLEDEEVEMKQGDQQHEDLSEGVRHCERRADCAIYSHSTTRFRSLWYAYVFPEACNSMRYPGVSTCAYIVSGFGQPRLASGQVRGWTETFFTARSSIPRRFARSVRASP